MLCHVADALTVGAEDEAALHDCFVFGAGLAVHDHGPFPAALRRVRDALAVGAEDGGTHLVAFRSLQPVDDGDLDRTAPRDIGHSPAVGAHPERVIDQPIVVLSFSRADHGEPFTAAPRHTDREQAVPTDEDDRALDRVVFPALLLVQHDEPLPGPLCRIGQVLAVGTECDPADRVVFLAFLSV